jgi:anti-sigma regulatory factor (Ser/Thr protein kinase)
LSMTDERLFANTPESVTQARYFAMTVVGGVPREVEDAVAVMVSELATNSLRHAGTDFSVRVDRDDAKIRVAVTDAGPGQPAIRSPRPREPTGRGLQIVRALADDWGVTPLQDGRGKMVWFTLGVPPPEGSSRDPARAIET